MVLDNAPVALSCGMPEHMGDGSILSDGESVAELLFLRIDSARAGNFERALTTLREAGARIIETFPPSVVIVKMDPARTQALVYTAGLRGVYPHAISDAQLERMPADARPAALAWNTRQRDRDLDGDKAGLGWDAPGHLPPDLPPGTPKSPDHKT